MTYFSPQAHVEVRENPFNTESLNTVTLLLVKSTFLCILPGAAS